MRFSKVRARVSGNQIIPLSNGLMAILPSKDDLPVLSFGSLEHWETWLDENHASSAGLWLALARKSSGLQSVSYAEALAMALCYGWIDGQKGAGDETFWLQRFTPRRPKSKWSEVNREKANELISLGMMKPAGLKEVEAARQDGRWELAYKSQRNMPVPEDLQEKLDQNPQAREFFATLNSANRYAILYRIHDAKKPETRVRRIEKFVAMLEERKTLH